MEFLPMLLLLALLFDALAYIWLTKKQRIIIFIMDLFICIMLVITLNASTQPPNDGYGGMGWILYYFIPSIFIDCVIKGICILIKVICKRNKKRGTGNEIS